MPISCYDPLAYFTMSSAFFFFFFLSGVPLIFLELDFLGVLLPDLAAFGLKFSLCLFGDLDFYFFLLGVEMDSSLPIMPFTSLFIVLMEVPALLVSLCCFWAAVLCVLLRILDILDTELPPLLIGETSASLFSSSIGTIIFYETSLLRCSFYILWPDFSLNCSFQVVLCFKIFFVSTLLLLSFIGNSISLVNFNLFLPFKPPVNSS